MSRYLFLLFLFLQPAWLFAQNSEPESDHIIIKDSIAIKTHPLPISLYKIEQSKSSLDRYSDFSIKTKEYIDPFEHIENLDFKFRLRELELEAHDKTNKSVDKAVNTLLNYVKNDSVRQMVSYLKDYFEKRQTEEALKELAKQVSIENQKIEQIDSLTEEVEFELRDDAQKYTDLYNYIEYDSIHQWIREISRDSVSFAVRNAMNDSLAFWINNGKSDFKRFWLKRSKRDSIGVWLQNTKGKGIRILYDDDVYQESVQNTKRKGTSVRLEKKISDDAYQLAKLKKYRRYEDIWKLGTIIKLDFNQGHVSESWAEGGESSISTLSGIQSFAKYKKNKTSWETLLDLQYGLIKSGENDFRKNEDKLELNTKFGQWAFKKWYYTAMFNLKTQFVKGYNYPNDESRELISNFFAPAYLLGAVGLDYKPKKEFSVLISPFTAKYTIVSDTANIDQTAFGIDADKKLKKEVGSYLKVLHKWKLTKEISMENKLEFYSSYSNNPENIDIDWQFILNLPINQYLTTTISTYLISDDDTGSKVQFKENFAVGVSYRF